MNIYKLPRKASFPHFYYKALSIVNSKELVAFLKANEWYYRKQKPEVQAQLKRLYEKLKSEEEYVYK